jgi:prefoldin alpha subunit
MSSSANRPARRPSATLGSPVQSDQGKLQEAQQQFNQLVAEVRLLESYYNEVLTRQQSLSAALIDTRAALDSLESLPQSENADVLVPIGGGALIPVSVPPITSVVVSIGAGVALEKNRDSAKAYLDSRKQELEKGVTTLEQQRKEIGSRLEVGRATLQRIAESTSD